MPPEFGGDEQHVHRVENRTVPGPGGPIPIRVYRPSESVAPGMVYFHGGGFVIGGLDMNDRPCRSLANQSGCVIVSVDYRLAPEHKFPAAVDDAFAATEYVASHAAEFGIDATRLAVGGDSAGANLATVTAILARERGGPSLAFQMLVYPLVDYDDDSPSMSEYGAGHFLTQEAMDYFTDHYLRTPDQRRDVRASPLRADLAGLPPALVVTAECDPLRDQGEAYARKLQQAGVPTTLRRYEGMIHPFFSLGGIIDDGKQAVTDIAATLREALRA